MRWRAGRSRELPARHWRPRRAARGRFSKFARNCPGREWVQAAAEDAVVRLTIILGAPVAPTEVEGLSVYDDWRDWVRPRNSKRPRRLWGGVERRTTRIKLIHSVHSDLFRNFCPTYSYHGIDWLAVWGWPKGTWAASTQLHPLDKRMVEIWSEIVEARGYGVSDRRVGWLREGALLRDLQQRFQAEGLVPLDVCTVGGRCM